MLWKKCMDF